MFIAPFAIYIYLMRELARDSLRRITNRTISVNWSKKPPIDL